MQTVDTAMYHPRIELNLHRLNPDIKARWVTALRSGTYHQGVGRLTQRTPHGDYDCCLGVLCKVENLDYTICQSRKKVKYLGYSYGDILNYSSAANLPEDFAEILGVSAGVSLYILGRNGLPESLTELNDDGFTFDQIADLIEYFL